MPIFRINQELHYFAHVPKCAGASVEAYLRARFGPIAFANSRFLSKPEAQRWTRSSPQHVDWESLGRLIPHTWIKSSFAIVRHPMTRLRSAFDYQLRGERTVPEGTDINDWFLDWVEGRAEMPFRYDNHPRPATELVPPDATVFRLEDGMQSLVAHLDRLAGNADGPRNIPHKNRSRGGSNYAVEQTVFSPGTLSVIAKIYAKDFRRFGYDCDESALHSPPATSPPRLRWPVLTGLIRRG